MIVHLSDLDLGLAGLAAIGSGAVNALAGGGTLISFPTLVALGVPVVGANVTNTVSLLPGYLAGSWTQRDDLRPELATARIPTLVAAAGGLAGSALLIVIPSGDFRAAVPFLILLSCALLFFQARLRKLVRGPAQSDAGGGPDAPAGTHWSGPLLALLFAAAAYGGFFGAGLGIMLLAVLGLFTTKPLTQANALKQALSFVVNLVAAVFFAFSGHVVWELVPVMAVGSLLGGLIGGRLVQVIDSEFLRRIVVVAGVAVAISFWVA